MKVNNFLNIPESIKQVAAQQPDKQAIICGDRTVSWSEFDRNVDSAAEFLTNSGICTGDRIAVLSGNCPEYIEWIFGILRAGGCVVPLPVSVHADALIPMLADSDAKLLIVSRKEFQKLETKINPLLKEIPLGYIYPDFHRQQSFKTDNPAKTEFPGQVTIAPETLFNIIYSSGTTGVPKGIVHSHRMRSYQAQRMISLGFDSDNITLVATPFSSNTTLACLFPAMISGGTIILMERFDAREFLRLAELYQATHTMMVPVQYQRVMDAWESGRYDLDSFKLMVSTGAMFPVKLKRKIIENINCRLVEIYGVTEGGCTTVLDVRKYPDKIGSVGKAAEGIDVRILDDNGRVLPRGQTGEIAGRAVSMMNGYHKRQDLTDQISWRDNEGKLFYRTGDLGFIDGDGFLYLRGRKKDVIISGGTNIYASDLEQVLLQHPEVKETAVIGVESDKWGETPVAYVALNPGSQITDSELLEWVNNLLGKHQRILKIVLKDNLPRNSMGKVLKDRLELL